MQLNARRKNVTNPKTIPPAPAELHNVAVMIANDLFENWDPCPLTHKPCAVCPSLKETVAIVEGRLIRERLRLMPKVRDKRETEEPYVFPTYHVPKIRGVAGDPDLEVEESR